MVTWQPDAKERRSFLLGRDWWRPGPNSSGWWLAREPHRPSSLSGVGVEEVFKYFCSDRRTPVSSLLTYNVGSPVADGQEPFLRLYIKPSHVCLQFCKCQRQVPIVLAWKNSYRSFKAHVCIQLYAHAHLYVFTSISTYTCVGMTFIQRASIYSVLFVCFTAQPL